MPGKRTIDTESRVDEPVCLSSYEKLNENVKNFQLDSTREKEIRNTQKKNYKIERKTGDEKKNETETKEDQNEWRKCRTN